MGGMSVPASWFHWKGIQKDKVNWRRKEELSVLGTVRTENRLMARKMVDNFQCWDKATLAKGQRKVLAKQDGKTQIKLLGGMKSNECLDDRREELPIPQKEGKSEKPMEPMTEKTLVDCLVCNWVQKSDREEVVVKDYRLGEK